MPDQVLLSDASVQSALTHLRAPQGRGGIAPCVSVAVTGSAAVDSALGLVDGVSSDVSSSLGHASSALATWLASISSGFEQLDADLGGVP
ncbi:MULTISPECIES: hypothetical protein [unclassified Microbacterium]|uniref:hypothetical protein n=1 Tax=unclassified Microbacterium TaxID=2609290 RepID=UPI0012F7DE1E|nr:hypothetical protein [Microbacterium sp. MAH-37]MVQ43903.1 hypothetical protein [Microbacterium sp. MAH-37]